MGRFPVVPSDNPNFGRTPLYRSLHRELKILLSDPGMRRTRRFNSACAASWRINPSYYATAQGEHLTPPRDVARDVGRVLRSSMHSAGTESRTAWLLGRHQGPVDHSTSTRAMRWYRHPETGFGRRDIPKYLVTTIKCARDRIAVSSTSRANITTTCIATTRKGAPWPTKTK